MKAPYHLLSALALISCSKATVATLQAKNETESQTNVATHESSENAGANLLVTNSAKKFSLDSTIALKKSYWKKHIGPTGLPPNYRLSGMSGKSYNGCAEFGYHTAYNGFNYPTLSADASVKGPSYEGDIGGEHFIHNEIPKIGTPKVCLSNFDSTGEDGNGTNNYILPIYAGYSFSTGALVVKPWSGVSIDINRVRGAFRSTQRVVNLSLPDPTNQQLQQALRFILLNKACTLEERTAQKKCQLELNMKTFLKGKNIAPNTHQQEAKIYGDPAQGGIVAVLMNFNTAGQTLRYTYPNGTKVAFGISWGEPTQTNKYNTNKNFQMEISWPQFQNILTAIASKAAITNPGTTPATIYGNEWNNADTWYLLRAAYGQENYNQSSATHASFIDGSFKDLQVIALP